MKLLKELARRTQVPEEYKDKTVWTRVLRQKTVVSEADARGTDEKRYILNRPWRGENSYVLHTNEDAPRVIEQKLAITNGRQIRVLDTSAGHGAAIRGLKDEYGDRVHTTACSLTDIIIPGNAEEVRLGLFECQRFETPFDVIFDMFGAVNQGVVRAVILKKIIESLVPSGVAYITIPFINGWDPHSYTPIIANALKIHSENGTITTQTFYPNFKTNSGHTFKIIKND